MKTVAKLQRSDKSIIFAGALVGLLLIKTQPDGNLLVTSVFTIGTGSVALGLWLGLKKLSGL